jgi:hypothetical protein
MRSQSIVLVLLALTTACKGGGGGSSDAPILGPYHMGWKSQECSFCHELPRPGHSATHPSECASCHGGNGACDPNGEGSARVHASADSCTGCHSSMHGFDQPSHCQACHFAFAGTDDCHATIAEPGPDAPDDVPVEAADVPTDGAGPVLSTAVVESCFGWPETEFSPTNYTTVLTGLAEGALAVELTLSDVDGTSYTLSELLADRPVLLVFGAFT